MDNVAAIASVMIAEYSTAKGFSSKFSNDEWNQKTHEIFTSDKKGLEWIQSVDSLIDLEKDLEPLREYFIDLAVLKMMEAAGEEGESFLESEEMDELEDATLDRGTEFLNLLVYLRECAVAEIELSMDDFLNEFLLVSEEGFQDEYFIYEDVIRHQKLIEGTVDQIVESRSDVKADEMKEVFIPLLVFFSDPTDEEGASSLALKKKGPRLALENALYVSLVQFHLMEMASAD